MLLVEPKGPASAKRGDQPSRQRAKRVPRLAVLVQIPTPSRAEGGEARGAPVTSGSCLTLFAESLHPAAPLREQLRSEAEEGGAQHNPGPLLLRGTGTRTTAPPGHPSHFAQSSGSGRLLTLIRTPLQLFAKVPVPGCLGIGAELLRPQRQSLRLTSPGGGG